MFTQNKKNHVFVILTTTKSMLLLINCVQINNNDDNYLTFTNSEKFIIIRFDISTVKKITFFYEVCIKLSLNICDIMA